MTYFHENVERSERALRESAAAYLGAHADEVAITGNTTTGLALLYGGLPLARGQEIVTSTHDHYVTYESLRLRSVHTGAPYRKVQLYAAPETATEDEIVSNLVKAVGPRTRAVAVTWVHSSTGVKLPIRRMADALAGLNKRRAEADRVLLCVDGVHGFGVESENMADLGCDFFVAGCHKWIFGPRGTGLVWGRAEAWKGHAAIDPDVRLGRVRAVDEGPAAGFAAARPAHHAGRLPVVRAPLGAAEAFAFHQQLGRARVTARIHELRDPLQGRPGGDPVVKLRTPRSEALSAGLVCFEVAGKEPKAVVDHLATRKIVASTTPYAQSFARFSPSILNTPEEVDRAVAEVRGVCRLTVRARAALRSCRAAPPTSSRSTREARSPRAGSPAACGTRSPAVHSRWRRAKSVAAAIGFSPCLRHSASARRMCAAEVTSRNGSLPTSGGSSAASSEVSSERASSVMRSRGMPMIIAVCGQRTRPVRRRRTR